VPQPANRRHQTYAWWHGQLSDLLTVAAEDVETELAAAAVRHRLTPTREQLSAWLTSTRVLAATARVLADAGIGERWEVALEFVLPRRAVRPDAVLLADDVIIPIEFKVGATTYERADRMQAVEYAWDLRDFHATSAGHAIVPVLVATSASTDDIDLGDDSLFERAQCTSPDGLPALLKAITARWSPGGPQIDGQAWSRGRYQPTPGILEAAREVYAGHDVRELSLSYADNLRSTVEAVRSIIDTARATSTRAVCFVTGVPGSGKTLVGLSAVHEDAAGVEGKPLGAYLSGNGPLVQVLRYAIAKDLSQRDHRSAQEAERLASVFIQPVHRFVQELAQTADEPPEHVVVFDEAQRAWDARQMEKKQGIPASEASTMLSIMERKPDWAVVIALVGEGQEINDGEAGVEAWIEAVEAHPTWSLHAAPSFAMRAASVHAKLTVDPALELEVSVRSPRARAIAQWAEAVTSGDIAGAATIARDFGSFPLRLTRDLAVAKRYLQDRARPDRRVGLLASSQARRLRAFGLEMDTGFQSAVNWPRWFVDPADDLRSSYTLEIAASEFKCQGLEIDWAGLCWGSDFTWDPATRQWRVQRLRGSSLMRDSRVTHAKNRYRVLLTRARFGLVIWIPKVSPEAPVLLVDGDALDASAEALIASGCLPLEE
jgi:hypothetical protein